MTYCTCPRPVESSNPRRKGWCAACAFQFDPEWLSSDENTRRFFDRLQRSMPSHDSEWQAFRQMCEERERDGRQTFGVAYLSKDNLKEATEEAGDLAIYPLLDSLRAIREGRAGEDYDLVLTIAHHAFQAYSAAVRLQHKRHHCP